ncbi:MAG: hypothetical protein ACU83P_12305, partial [Gammaproteobacteria bacterium]
MLIIPGPVALSDFRIIKLLADLKAVEPAVRSVSARFMHFVDQESALPDNDQNILKQLLSYGSDPVELSDEGIRLLVVPRPGTISPWSSKATEIAQRCGLDAVNRIERGIEYALQAEAPLTDAV